MFCPNCGTPVPNNTNSCPRCQENLSGVNNVDPVQPISNQNKAASTIAIIFSIIIIFAVMIVVFASASN
ncbi:MAG: hypothetical protein WC702_04810 [Patescibacteria group bacterium]